MIISLLKLKPIPEKQNAVLDILRFVKDRVTLMRGCLESVIYQECDPDPMILYLEHWQSKEDLNRHIQSSIYLRVLNAMDLCREKPEILFYDVSNMKGMEWIATLRLNNERLSFNVQT